MRKLFTLALALAAFAAFGGTAAASHSWSTYHWARTSNPFTIKVINANTPAWSGQLDEAIAGWNNSPQLYSPFTPRWLASPVLNVVKESGAADKRCRAVAGKVKSCNGSYGQNGWLGQRVRGPSIPRRHGILGGRYRPTGPPSRTRRRPRETPALAVSLSGIQPAQFP